MTSKYLKMITRVYVGLFAFLLCLLLCINSATIKVYNNSNELYYQYYLSLSGNSSQLFCDEQDNKYNLQQIAISTIATNNVIHLNFNQKTSCHDIVSANNALGIVKVAASSSINQAVKSSLLSVSVVSFVVSSLVFVLLWLGYYLIRVNNYLYSFANHRDKVLFIQLVLIFGTYSLILGQDFNWDLANYHFYNGWAFLHDRISIDVTPNNGLHGYFSPILDSFLYLLITYLPLQMYAFLMGAISGIATFVCYKISQLLFKDFSNSNRSLLIACSTVIASTNVAHLIQIGTSTNETIVSLLIIIAIYLLMISQSKKITWVFIALSGFIMGVAVGFKLTAAIIVVGIIFSTLFLSHHRYRTLMIVSIFVVIGFIITDGVWMYKMYIMFGNPIFPNFGKYINPNTAIEFQRDTTFIPKDLVHWLFMPIYLCVPSKLTAEGVVSEPRFLITFIVMIVMLLKARLSKLQLDKNIIFSIWIFIISYVMWLALFSIIRYTIILGFMSGFIIVYGLNILIRNQMTSKVLTVIITLLILLSSKSYNLGHISYQNRFYNSDINISNSLIIFNENPTAYIIPDLGSSNIYINAPNLYFTSNYDHARKVRILQNAISNHKDLYLVVKSFEPDLHLWLSEYNLKFNQESCQKFNQISDVYVCKVMYVQ